MRLKLNKLTPPGMLDWSVGYFIKGRLDRGKRIAVAGAPLELKIAIKVHTVRNIISWYLRNEYKIPYGY